MKFYDTSSLLLKAGTLFDDNEYFAISSITLKELEEIKTSFNKDANIKKDIHSFKKKISIIDK